MVTHIGNYNIPGYIHSYASRMCKLAILVTLGTKMPDIFSVSIEQLYSMILRIRDQDLIIIVVHYKIARCVHLTRSISWTSKLEHKLTIRGKHLYPVILHVGYQNLIASRYSHAPGRFKIPITNPLTTEFANEAAIFVKYLDSIVSIIAYNDSASVVYSDVSGAVKFTFAVTMATE